MDTTSFTNQTNPKNPNSIKFYTKSVGAIASIISYISIPFFVIDALFVLSSLDKLINPCDYSNLLSTSLLCVIIPPLITFPILTSLTIFWLVICIKMTRKINQGSKRALVILLAVSIYITITGNLIVYSNR